METLNEAVRVDTNTEGNMKKIEIWDVSKEGLKFRENLMVGIDGIDPDVKAVEEHEETLRAVFGSW